MKFYAKRLSATEIWKHGWANLGHAPHCTAPACGDKIKPAEWSAILIEDENGEIFYLEEDCVDWFENGHPDYGGAKGKLLWK